MGKIYTALGLMSGTSMDGVDASIVRSDGNQEYSIKLDKYFKYGELDLSDREIEKLISDRNVARGNKKFDLADRIRDQLLKKGIVLEDLDGKTIWKKKS